MNKELYLNELKNKLSGFDEELVNEIMQDYEEHFTLGYAQGKSDEQIIESLGSIDDFVKEIESSYKRNNKSNNMSFTIDLSSLNDLSDKLNNATEKLSKELTEKYDKVYSDRFAKYAQNAEKLAREAEKYTREFSEEFEKRFNEMKNNFDNYDDPFADFDEENIVNLNEETPNNEDEVELTYDKKIRKIIVRDFLGRIDVRHTDGGPYINYHNYGSLKEKLMWSFNCRTDDDTLILTLVRNNMANFTRFNHSPDCELEIAIDEIEAIEFVNCTSTDIDVEGIKTNSLISHLLSGDMNIDAIQAERVEIDTTSGDVEVSDSTIGLFDMKSTSGTVAFYDSVVDTMRIVSVSGDVELNDGIMHRAGISTTSGDIVLRGAELIKLGCESISGDIEAVIHESGEAHVKTTSGDILLELQNNNLGFVSKLKTSSGDISVHYGNIDLDELQNGNYTFNDQNIRIVASTLSGDIEITD